ncbi:hypothetical protein EJ06DRAFT_548705 [Trichodelitschia bisporula]|uniref:Uncharacterized protein n=1 Tax=Trichodelitschia bisporula TaxID=703511 RepID=A0A6G1HYD1_9PEZI|nr:hypothetical protein EJ06DRAFT_548705 [Trichodelitschia bisporula]
MAAIVPLRSPERLRQRPRASLQFPTPDILLEISSEPVMVKPRARAPSAVPPPAAADPVALHLLVETALLDSQSFEILSYEELEELKRTEELLAARVDAVRRRLALETKVRDAAKSLGRLYSMTKETGSMSPKMVRRSSGMSRETMEKADAELAASTKKCDELSRELYHLEQRLKNAQMRLVQHTAGILQLSQAQALKGRGFLPDGRPESPASMDKFEIGAAVENPGYERKLERQKDSLDGFIDELKGGKSPSPPKDDSKQLEAMAEIGKKLDLLTSRVREVLAQTNPAKAAVYDPEADLRATTADETKVSRQLDRLVLGLDDIAAERDQVREQYDGLMRQQNAELEEKMVLLDEELQSGEATREELSKVKQQNAQLQSELQTSVQENLTLQREYDKIEDEVIQELEELNNEIFDVIVSYSPDQKPNLEEVPDPTDGHAAQITYFRTRFDDVKTLLSNLTDMAERSRSASLSNADRSSQYEAVLSGLWDIILAGEDEVRRRKGLEREQLAARRAAGAETNSEDDLSPDEDDTLGTEFSLPAFSTKIQWLVSQLTYLKEKQSKLTRRIRQEKSKQSEAVQAATAAATAAAAAAMEAKTSDAVFAKEEQIKRLEDQLETEIEEARHEAKVAYADAQAKLDEAATKAQTLESDLAAATAAKERALADLEARDKAVKAMEEELHALEADVIRLTTELTMAKAEVDSAYGSRSQRAADAAQAANSQAQARLDELTARNAELTAALAALQADRDAAGKGAAGASKREQELKTELEGALGELEGLTRASVEAEKEREGLEGVVDGLRDKIEELETQLSDERVKALGMKSGPAGATTQTTSTILLKNEFKKMMRDTRTEHLKALRAEQEERRRLEALVRTLRREQGTGKSGLSQSMTA